MASCQTEVTDERTQFTMRKIVQAKVLVRHKGKYLLLKKARDAISEHIGGWEVPGGKVKQGETPRKAAEREVFEETGLKCTIIAELKLLKMEKENLKITTHVYLAETENKNVALSSEHFAYRWVSYGEIDSLKKVIYKELLKRYVREADKVPSVQKQKNY